jgi:hypothetical protein
MCEEKHFMGLDTDTCHQTPAHDHKLGAAPTRAWRIAVRYSSPLKKKEEKVLKRGREGGIYTMACLSLPDFTLRYLTLLGPWMLYIEGVTKTLIKWAWTIG